MKITTPKSGIVDLFGSFSYTYWTYARTIWSLCLAWPFWRYDLVWGPEHPVLVFITGFVVYILCGYIFRLPFFNFADRQREAFMFTVEVSDKVVDTDSNKHEDSPNE